MEMEPLFELHPAEERVRCLYESDPRFAALVDRIGRVTITGRRDPFQALSRALIGQQLSVKAAATICGRAEEACGGFTPARLLSVSEDMLRAAGVSKPKIGYIKSLAQAAISGDLHFDALAGLPDEEVVAALTKIKGIGRWTAEMYLIFSLGREDVLSLGDAGLRRAAGWLYADQEDSAAPGKLELLGERWKPYRTVASLYLWEAVNRGHVDSRL